MTRPSPDATFDQYFATLTTDEARELRRIREIALQEFPDCTEGPSYGMPALKWQGHSLIAMIAASKHLSIFPFSSTVVTSLESELAGYSLSSGTIRFTLERPLSEAVIREIVRRRGAEIAAREAAKPARAAARD